MKASELKNEAELLLSIHLNEIGCHYKTEVRLVPGRKWRWDFVVGRFAIEIQGGIWLKKGAHNTGLAITRDCVKMRAAIDAGFVPVNFTSEEVLTGTAKDWLAERVYK